MAKTVPLSAELASSPAWKSWEPLERAGEGGSAVVWKARRRATHGGAAALGAIKIARGEAEATRALAREVSLLARVGRRWGPRLLDAGPGFLATEWVEGGALDPAAGERRTADAVQAAHDVARALAELHESGAFHGDVKPQNVLGSARVARSGAAIERRFTLIDLGLGGAVGGAAHGGTPRYASPELRDRGEAGPAADLWALGLLLAECLDESVARAADPRVAIAGWTAQGEPARWVEALVSASPGGRPSAEWLASRAAAWLELPANADAERLARVDRVRRAVLASHAPEIEAGATRIAADLRGTVRSWLEEAAAWAAKIHPGNGSASAIEPLGPIGRARLVVSLVGTVGASWPLGEGEPGESELVARMASLAEERDPASWTLADLRGERTVATTSWDPGTASERMVRLAEELSRPAPRAGAITAAESDVQAGSAPGALALTLARALVRAGELGRAWAALSVASGPDADALRAEIARRRGEPEQARAHAERAVASKDGAARARAQATLARLAWDAGELDAAVSIVEGVRGAAAAEVRALALSRKGSHDEALQALMEAESESVDADARARLEAVRGFVEQSRGASAAALECWGRAAAHATRAGAVLDEATYLTSEAAAAVDVGDLGRALASGTRAALLWERLGRPALAARAWLARAGALSTMGATHETDEAAEAASARAEASRDVRAAAYARWARVEVRPPGAGPARAWALEADDVLGDAEDRARSAARLLMWAPDRIEDERLAATDAAVTAMSPPARWEWWGARAAAIVAGRKTPRDEAVLPALVALVEVPAPLSSRGPALDAAVRLATDAGNGEVARRLEHARQEVARVLRAGTPARYAASLAGVVWARAGATAQGEVTFVPAQVAQLEAIVRSLSGRERLRPLLEQVLDTLVLWTGVERGLLLLRAPDDKLVPRAARNLARHDLVGEQLVLSQTIARRAMAEGDAVVATDAFSTLGEVHASVHALKLRSVLAVPLVARGETLGVVYLDDRVRRGAFGPHELAWVRVVASQAAMAIADARDAVLLRRAARRAERAHARVSSLLQESETQLDVTRERLALASRGDGPRHSYGDIVGRGEAMKELLRLMDRVTASDVPVLVVGESGTGKELVARAVHTNGPRGQRSFVSENCASVPETLLETTLFGHVRGAFTGASGARAGLFEVADGGTLFLDEIGEMSIAMQSKLLRVLQDGEVRPVGGERSRRVDVRVIGATHRDLAELVAAGRFREDLLYRLDVITLPVPPLRERSEDIPALVDHFVRKHGAGRGVKVTRAAMGKLATFAWPGNVRQLENEIRRALVMGDDVIDVPELSADVARGGPSAARGTGLDLRARVDALEAELVSEALRKTRGNQTRAAKLLGLSRFGLQKMMKRLNVKVS